LMEEDKSLGFEVEIELEPEIKLPKYRGIKVNASPAGVSDEELQQQIDNIRKNYATLEPVEDDKVATEGDFVNIDFNGKIEGKEFEGGSAQDYSLELGSKILFPEIKKSMFSIRSLAITMFDCKLTSKSVDFKVSSFGVT